MHDTGFSSCCHREPAFFHDFQHGRIFRQDFCDERAETCRAGEGRDLPHQDRSEPLTLIGVDDCKGHLGVAAIELDVSRATGDYLFSVFVDFGNDCDVIHKIDLQEKMKLAFGEFAPRTEKAPKHRLRAGSIDRSQHALAVVRAYRADENGAPVSQGFGREKCRGRCHGR